MATTDAALRLDGVSKSYGGRRVVDGVSFAESRGHIMGLVGPNGAGKTTLIRIVMGIVTPEAGRVTVLGRPGGDPTHAAVGYLPEERGLYQRQTVQEVLSYLAKLKGIGRHRSDRRISVWLERLGIAEAVKRPVRDLSKGMQQKVQFVAAVLHDPDLLLLDEPFGGLDPVSRQQMRAILQELAATGKTILLSSHEMAEVEALCPEVVMVHLGRVVLSGSVQALRTEFGDHAVLVRAEGDLAAVPGVLNVEKVGDRRKVTLARDCRPRDFLPRMFAAGLAVEHFEIARPSLEDIFVHVATSGDRGASQA